MESMVASLEHGDHGLLGIKLPTLFAAIVVDLKERGRGVMAKKEMKVGDLILVENALLVVASGHVPALARRMADLKLLEGEKSNPRFPLHIPLQDLRFDGELAATRDQEVDDAHIVAAMKKNNFYSDGKTVLGGFASMFNHSCAPNAFIKFHANANVVVVRASKPIAEGEEITVSYIPLLVPHGARRTQLKKWDIPRCFCDRCEQEARLPPHILRLFTEHSAAFEGNATMKKKKMAFNRLYASAQSTNDASVEYIVNAALGNLAKEVGNKSFYKEQCQLISPGDIPD